MYSDSSSPLHGNSTREDKVKQTDVGCCRTSYSLWRSRVLAGAQLAASRCHSGCCASCLHWALPPWLPSGDRSPPGLLRWTRGPYSGSRGMTERIRVAQIVRRFWRSSLSVVQIQHDVCDRAPCACVPTCTAAQLGLHVPARHPERSFRCVQDRVGHSSSGREHLQAQRSWPELQLSQQLLPSEKRGTTHAHSNSYNFYPLIHLVFFMLHVINLSPKNVHTHTFFTPRLFLLPIQ